MKTQWYRRRENLNLILFELKLCIWRFTVDGPRFLYVRTWYKELARLKVIIYSYYALNAFTRHKMEFDLKLSLYFLILAIIK